MKKNFLTAAAIMVTAFLLATTIAQASDVTMGGEFWTRYEVMERNDFNDDTEADSYFQSRIRLNATANINESTSAFIQLQSNRTWGDIMRVDQQVLTLPVLVALVALMIKIHPSEYIRRISP